ncbi:hypothetical protein B0T24DRAFT_703879, partial [Lasiosphaeria ovina]
LHIQSPEQNIPSFSLASESGHLFNLCQRTISITIAMPAAREMTDLVRCCDPEQQPPVDLHDPLPVAALCGCGHWFELHDLEGLQRHQALITPPPTATATAATTQQPTPSSKSPPPPAPSPPFICQERLKIVNKYAVVLYHRNNRVGQYPPVFLLLGGSWRSHAHWFNSVTGRYPILFLEALTGEPEESNKATFPSVSHDTTVSHTPSLLPKPNLPKSLRELTSSLINQNIIAMPAAHEIAGLEQLYRPWLQPDDVNDPQPVAWTCGCGQWFEYTGPAFRPLEYTQCNPPPPPPESTTASSSSSPPAATTRNTAWKLVNKHGALLYYERHCYPKPPLFWLHGGSWKLHAHWLNSLTDVPNAQPPAFEPQLTEEPEEVGNLYTAAHASRGGAGRNWYGA